MVRTCEKSVTMNLFCFLIIFFLNSLQISYGITPQAVAVQNQIDIFNSFSDGSWQSKKVEHHNDYILSISDAIIRIFNNTKWNNRQNTTDKIIPPIDALFPFSNYYDNCFELDDTPEEVLSKISFKEICRFKDFLQHNPTLILDNNFATDDLVKARSISGIFWIVDTTGETQAQPLFSGMLIPGQSFGLMTYQVLTCFHGFRFGNAQNKTEYYFVPYGVAVDSLPESDNYVVNKGFKVTHITHYRSNGENHLSIDDQYFNENSQSISDDICYSERDLAIAFIKGKTLPLKDEGKNLHTVLLQTNLNLFHADDIHLPVLPHKNEFLSVEMNEEEERLFSIGLAAEPELALSHNMIVSTSLKTGDRVKHAPRRAFLSEQNHNPPSFISSRNEEGSCFLASFGGMSGGPILRCRLDPNNVNNKKCVVIATLWGDGRIYDDSSKIIAMKSIVNLTE
ncbi:MAG: hypothetical protein HEEMFOPI_01577 [Holosporales bacterium]